HGLGLDRDAPLALEIHRVEQLGAHVAARHRLRHLEDAIGEDIDVNQVISFWLLHNFFQHWVDATKGEMNRDTCPTFFDMMESEMGSRYWALTEHTFTREWRDEVALALQRSQRP
ncbi:MAG: hypothetical protein RLZZ93_869, partial [Actinomycetota bacterium]